MQRAEHVPAFVLHRREWQDNGAIFELFTQSHGRLSVFARGVRGAGARLAGVLQPFVPLLVSWAGRGEAPRLTGAEPDHAAAVAETLAPARLMSAWYCTRRSSGVWPERITPVVMPRARKTRPISSDW